MRGTSKKKEQQPFFAVGGLIFTHIPSPSKQAQAELIPLFLSSMSFFSTHGTLPPWLVFQGAGPGCETTRAKQCGILYLF